MQSLCGAGHQHSRAGSDVEYSFITPPFNQFQDRIPRPKLSAETILKHGQSQEDVDPSNAAFSRYFADVARPDTDNPAGV